MFQGRWGILPVTGIFPTPGGYTGCGRKYRGEVQVNKEMLGFYNFCESVCGVFFKFMKDRVADQRLVKPEQCLR